MDGVVLINENVLKGIREQFDNTKNEILNLINDYIDNNCVEFKIDSIKNEFNQRIDESIKKILVNLDNSHVILNDNNYSNSINSNNINLSNYSKSNASISLQ